MSETAQLSSPSSPATRGLAWWMLALIILIAGAVYANSIENGYAFDDVAIVQNNPHVVNLEWTAIWNDGYWPRKNGFPPDALYRPLTLWTYLANQAVLPDVAYGFHFVNVFIHAIISGLVALLAWRLLGNRLVAFVAGLLFAVHPLHTEAVANIVGRAELLATLWALLTLLVFMPREPLTGAISAKARPWWHGLLVAACFFAAMLCKETPVTLLAAVVLLDVWMWARMTGEGRPKAWRWMLSRSVRYYVPMGVALGAYLAMRINACGLMSPVAMTSSIVNPLVQATVGERIVTPFLLLAKYLALIFWPVNLSADYSFPSLLPTANPMAPLALVGILTCVLTLIFSIRGWKRAPQLVLIAGLFFLSYALIANVIRIGTIFGERLFYAPSVFVLILIAWAGVSLFYMVQPQIAAGRWAVRGIAGLVLTGLVVAMSMRVWVRNTDWEGNEALAISTARDNLQSGKACAWAANVLLTSHRPEYDPFALTLLDRAVELAPDYAEARWTIAKYYGVKGDLAKSLIYLAQAVRLEPGDHYTRAAMNAALIDLRNTSPEKYMTVLTEWQETHPDDESIYLALAMAYHAQKMYPEAEKNAIEALLKARRPAQYVEFHEAGAELATIRFDRGDQKEGIDEFRIYVKNLKHSVDARCDFARMLLSADTKAHPEFVLEAEYNLMRADSIEQNNPRVRQLRGELARLRKSGGSEGATANAAITNTKPDMPGPVEVRP